MAVTLSVSNQFAFADGNAGHSCALGSAPSVGDFDLLFICSNTVVTTPSGFTIATSNVGSQGAYLYYRKAVGGEASSVTITTSGDHNTAVTHERWTGLSALDTHTVAAVDGVLASSTPSVSTGTMAGTGQLVVMFGALHAVNGGGQNTPVWTNAFVATFSSPATIGTSTTGVANWTSHKTGAGTAAESTVLSWSGNTVDDRYTLSASFTASGGATLNADGAVGVTDTIAATQAVTRPANGTAVTVTDTIAGTQAVTRNLDGTAVAVTNTIAATIATATTQNAAGAVVVTSTIAGTLALGSIKTVDAAVVVQSAIAATLGTAPLSRGPSGWYGLLSIITESVNEQVELNAQRPRACPNDGEPLRSGPHGGLYCPYDGWRYDG